MQTLMEGLLCPECGCDKSHVTDTRPYQKGIRRRRECENCGHRWSTYECTVSSTRMTDNRIKQKPLPNYNSQKIYSEN